MMLPKPKKKKKKYVSKKIDNYIEMFFYVSHIWGYWCPIALEHGEQRRPQSLHHRLPDSNKNIIRFPLFIHSVFNLVAVDIDYHSMYDSWGQYAVYEADKMEKYLIENMEVLNIGFFSKKEEVEKLIKEILK